MKATAIAPYAVAALLVAAVSGAQPQDIDLRASDGIVLKGTYSSPARPGPGMLLIHQCNMDRTSWTTIADELVDAGVHVLTLDLRGFGESGGEGMSAGFPTLLQKSAGDADMAYEYLAAQPGVDIDRIGVGGASCGGMINADLAARKPAKALMLLSSPPSAAAVENMAASPELAVFGAATEDDPVTQGVADALRAAVASSEHPNSKAMIYEGTEHGLPMFERNPDLEPALLDWLKTELN